MACIADLLQHQRAFEECAYFLRHCATLAEPRIDEQLILFSDACEYVGIGGVCVVKRAGKVLPVSFCGSELDGAQPGYHILNVYFPGVRQFDG
ncbi:hypothetical protein SARC_02539 [Sphaeroforma arctica JP610]|uniref:Reverse transcriptase/retrotransposon-derived protein RNase H-like domain-containing protein n=1 Tax=Sphaeroforma arctica JP610 TaxID=667725 RepID=A0A0L0G8F3_9EUKA|nr:hypothetical protein SARC_02539 [Sphaeroforma arctica JP610]KNC85280.1 hypothetical protein SARC_02539 [Sphaeroforma arctica JP610]|eukprot:XP_014159182.1 hypothetical protein SARC_02539 [Sphaeroforma arctica JP610]